MQVVGAGGCTAEVAAIGCTVGVELVVELIGSDGRAGGWQDLRGSRSDGTWGSWDLVVVAVGCLVWGDADLVAGEAGWANFGCVPQGPVAEMEVGVAGVVAVGGSAMAVVQAVGAGFVESAAVVVHYPVWVAA